MRDPDQRLWPFKPRTALGASILFLIGILVIITILRTVFNLLPEVSDDSLSIGVIFLSLLPILLSIIDNFLDRGGSIEYKGVKINFAQVPQLTSIRFTVPIDIGVSGRTVKEDTSKIIEELRNATSCNVVIIDLKDGQAWRETRLLVLLAGATRRGRPAKIVFVGADYNAEENFLGWAHANDLLNYLLLAHPQYLLSYRAAMAAARQWQLVESFDTVSSIPSIIQGDLAKNNIPESFSPKGLRFTDDFYPELLLATDVETVKKMEPRLITLVRFEELFRQLLHRQHIDLCWLPERQFDSYFESDDDYLVITKNGRYDTIVSKLAILNVIVKEMTK